MRKHDVRSQIDSNIPTEYMQYEINLYATIFVKSFLDESRLLKEDKLKIIDNLIEFVKSNSKYK